MGGKSLHAKTSASHACVCQCCLCCLLFLVGVSLSDFGKVTEVNKLGVPSAGVEVKCTCMKPVKPEKYAIEKLKVLNHYECNDEDAKFKVVKYTPVDTTSSSSAVCTNPQWVFVAGGGASDVWPCEGQFRPELIPPENVPAKRNIMCGGVQTASWDLFSIGKMVS